MQLPPIPPDTLQEGHSWRDWFSLLRASLASGVSGTFTTADVPAKTVTVLNGIITAIK